MKIKSTKFIALEKRRPTLIITINHTGISTPFCILVIDLRVLPKLRVDKADRRGGGAGVIAGVSSLTELLITNESYTDDNPGNKIFSSRGECNGAEREREGGRERDKDRERQREREGEREGERGREREGGRERKEKDYKNKFMIDTV